MIMGEIKKQKKKKKKEKTIQLSRHLPAQS